MSDSVLMRTRFASFRHGVWVGGLLWACLAAFAGGQDQKTVQAGPAPPRVHFVLCGLTKDAYIGDAVRISLEDVKRILQTEVDPQYIGSLQVVNDDDCNAEKILATIKRVQINMNDALYCYYAGHGGYDPARAEGDLSHGHHFQIPSGDLMRKTLFQ